MRRALASAFLAAAMMAGQPGAQAARIECVAGCGAEPKLVEPFGVAAAGRGQWFICEYKGQRISRFDRQGRVTHFAAGPGAFNDPHGLVIAAGRIYVADTLNHRVVAVDLKSGRRETVAGTGQKGFSGDGGPAAAATFDGIYAIASDPRGAALYLTDLQNRRIRRMDLKSGILTTVAGNGQTGVPADGAAAVAGPLVDPRAAAVDARGNLYILERRGNALRVVDTGGRIRTVIAPGLNAPGTVQPNLNGPKHLCVDGKGRVLIADAENHLVRRYDPGDGTTVIIAGTGEKGDAVVAGDPRKTLLNRPHGVFVDRDGAIFISDSYNHRILKLVE